MDYFFKKKTDQIGRASEKTAANPLTELSYQELLSYSAKQVYSASWKPVVNQHYWGCNITLFYSTKGWILKIEDIFAVDRWQDDSELRCYLLPKDFPNTNHQELQASLLAKSPIGPHGGGSRLVSLSEIAALCNAGRSFLGGK